MLSMFRRRHVDVEAVTPETVPKLFLSAGAMKAGTTWLYEAIRGHPELHSTPIKETHFFSREFWTWGLATREGRLARVRDYSGWLTPDYDHATVCRELKWIADFLSDPVDAAWFARLFPRRDEAVYCTDFSNLHGLLRGDDWLKVRAASPHLRVLYTLRNPLHRLWSHAKWQFIVDGRMDEIEGATVETFRRVMEDGGVDRHGEYAAFIAGARQHLDPSELRIAVFDDFRESAIDELRRLEAFLAIAPLDYDPDVLSTPVNMTPWPSIPPTFLEASRPLVERELAALARSGEVVPTAWLRDHRDGGALIAA